MGDEPASSMDTSLVSNGQSEGGGDSQLSDRLSRLSASSHRKTSGVSLESNGTGGSAASEPNGGYARGRFVRSQEVLVPPTLEDVIPHDSPSVSWQLFSVVLQRAPVVGFGIGVSGGRDNPHFVSGRDPHFVVASDPSILISDVLHNGPAFGLVQVNDRIVSANGVSLENADYATAVQLMREAQQLNMIVKRRVPIPLIELEQRTLKFTLSKSRKKDDFGITLGCKFYIKEITNPKLAEKEPGLKEGDSVLRINGTALDGVSLEEATRLLQRSREKLSLVVQRDVRRGAPGSRWPSQTTVYERLGSVSATPRQSPTPANYGPTASSSDFGGPAGHLPRRPAEYSPAPKRYSDPATMNYGQPQGYTQHSAVQQPAQFPLHQSHYGSSYAAYPNGLPRAMAPRAASQTPSVCSSPRLMGPTPALYASNYANNSPVPHAAHQQPAASQRAGQIEVIRFQKPSPDSSLGIRVIGGNHVGIFVSAVQEDSAASQHRIQMNGLTREEAVEHLLSLGSDVCVKLERCLDEYTQMKNHPVGDSFYIRTHFAYQRKSRLELSFAPGDIFHCTDSLFNGTVGYWHVTKVYSASEAEIRPAEASGVIPNLKTAEHLAKQARAMDSGTLGRTLFRKKLQTTFYGVNGAAMDAPTPAYERVALRKPAFKRPVVLFGPLADVARQLLLSNFALYFDTVNDENMIRMSSVKTNKHCLLNISPCSVERLQAAQFAPIVILIDVDSRNRIRELRSRAGATTASARRLLDQTAKIKKYHSHLLTGSFFPIVLVVHPFIPATLDALKEDGWFDALRMLIAHLQERRVWIPESTPANINELVLFPMQNAQDGDSESVKGADYAIYDATNPAETKRPEPTTASPARNTFASAFSRNAYGRTHPTNSTGHCEGSPGKSELSSGDVAYYDVKQILAEHYPSDSTSQASQQLSSVSLNPQPQSRPAASNLRGVNLSPMERRKELTVINGDHNSGGLSGDESTSNRKADHSPFDAPFIDDNPPNGESSVVEQLHAIVDWNGGTLLGRKSGVKLVIPASALPFGKKQEVFVKICRTETSGPNGQKATIPTIVCGPSGLHFNAPVEFKLPRGVDRTAAFDQPNNFVLKTEAGEEAGAAKVARERRRREERGSVTTGSAN
ncbi:hypothetical protein M3Y99_00342000 [Aphelenchoides fujianensis]|nr:hypothetical protein M3Y99_00342000 [Aphelenchoides fujianensis]